MTALAAAVVAAVLAAEAGGEESARPGAENADSLVRALPGALIERALSAPPVPAAERLDKAAELARGLVRPLPLPVAIAATAAGFALMLFGECLFRIGIVLYLATFLGFVGLEAGSRFGEGWPALVGGAVGVLAGAGGAIPLRAVARGLVGGLAGALLAAVIVQCLTSSWLVTLAAAACGLAASAALTAVFPRPLLVAGFSLFGAFAASAGILSVVTEPAGGRVPYGPAQVIGVVLAAVLGGLFQWHLASGRDRDAGE